MTSFIREKNLEVIQRHRIVQRERQHDNLRDGLDPAVPKLCNRIKRRSKADCEDLSRLSDAFLASETNISSFMKTQGALGVLVKELFSSSGEKQVLVTEVLCNLALGDEFCVEKLTTAIAPYLVPMVTSQYCTLAETSLWTLFNLIVASEKAQELLLAQQVDLKLLKLLEGNADENLKTEATKCLSVLSKSLLHGDLKTLDIVLRNWNLESPRLLYEILWRREFKVDDDLLDKLLNCLLSSLTHEDPPLAKRHQQLYTIRILGNLVVNPGISEKAVTFMIENRETTIKAFQRLLTDPEDAIHEETLWCLGNILVSSGPKEQQLIENVLGQLVVPRKPKYEFKMYMEQQEGVEMNM